MKTEPVTIDQVMAYDFYHQIAGEFGQGTANKELRAVVKGEKVWWEVQQKGGVAQVFYNLRGAVMAYNRI